MTAAPSAQFTLGIPPRLSGNQGVVHACHYYGLFEDAFLGRLDTCAGGRQALIDESLDRSWWPAAAGTRHLPGETVTVRAGLARVGRTSLTMNFTVETGMPGAPAVLAEGHTTYVVISGGIPVGVPAFIAPTHRETEGLA